MKQIKSLIPYQATISHISKLIIPIFSGMKKVGDETNEIVDDTIPGKTSDPSNLNDVLRQLRRYTGKSFSEALILESTNPQYNKRLFIELPVQHMKTTSAEHTL